MCIILHDRDWCMQTAWGPDAGVWRPERWLEGKGVAAMKKDANGHLRFIPFVTGAQNCLGQHVAMVRPFEKACSDRLVTALLGA